MKKVSARIGNPLASKAKFYAFALVFFGIPCAVSFVILLGRDGDYSQWLILIALAFGAAALWAAITWPYLKGVNARLQKAAQEATKKH